MRWLSTSKCLCVNDTQHFSLYFGRSSIFDVAWGKGPLLQLSTCMLWMGGIVYHSHRDIFLCSINTILILKTGVGTLVSASLNFQCGDINVFFESFWTPCSHFLDFVSSNIPIADAVVTVPMRKLWVYSFSSLRVIWRQGILLQSL
jgi:hypothetical protein